MSRLVGVLQAISSKQCYVTDFRVTKNTLSSNRTVTGVYDWRPELQGCIPGKDLQAHTSVRRLLFVTDVTHPDVMAGSPSTVILEQVCIVYSTLSS